MSGRVPLPPLSASAKPFGFQTLVASATWPSGTRWYGPAGFVAEACVAIDHPHGVGRPGDNCHWWALPDTHRGRPRLTAEPTSRLRREVEDRQRLSKTARSVTYQLMSGRHRSGPVLSAPDTLPVFGFKSEDLVTAPQRANGLCGRLRAEIDAELKIVTDRILTLSGGLSK
jgi:hypothetical protein